MDILSHWSSSFLRAPIDAAVDALVSLYLYGPWWLGCWNYVAQEDVCASLSRSAQLGSGFWLSHSVECSELIRERVKSHSLGLLVVFCVLNGIWLYMVATYYLVCRRPRRPVAYIRRLPSDKES